MMRESTLFTNPETNTDSYAEQFRSVVGVVLDSVAPLRTKFKQRGPKSNRWLTPEAVNVTNHLQPCQSLIKFSDNVQNSSGDSAHQKSRNGS